MCMVGTFCPKNRSSANSSLRDAWCSNTSVNAGSSNRSSLVTPSFTSAAYHARLVGTKTVNGPGPSNSRSKPAALSASAKKPESRSRRGDDSAAAREGRPGILRRRGVSAGGGGAKLETRCGAGGGMESCGAGPGVPKGGRGGGRGRGEGGVEGASGGTRCDGKGGKAKLGAGVASEPEPGGKTFSTPDDGTGTVCGSCGSRLSGVPKTPCPSGFWYVSLSFDASYS
mmetsp:Transcript_4248/g.16923  ORF Transcript_4248/g.16923 Transcript_4248/m.16923 type:complete len:227 (+) Transcript_4248:1731-2411(+)